MLIQLEHVKKKYGTFELDCSLELTKGCVTGLIGQNGAGKSTTFKAILGLISIDEGKIQILGKEPKKLTAAEREQIGVVLSDSGFSGYLMVKDIIPIMQGLYSKFDSAKFRNRCEQFGIPVNKQIREFSTGMRAKLKVIVAMSHETQLLVLDEPTAGLDVIARDELLDLLRQYMEQEDCGILISSHISSDLEGLCDDVYMIDKGKIIMHEDTDVLLGEYGLLKLSESQYQVVDKRYLLKVKKEGYGYCCLTNQKQYYLDNMPDITVEKGSIDEVITMMIRGE